MTETDKSQTAQRPRVRALSIRQPYAELILRGNKPIEFRSRRTHIRGRFLIYAPKSRGPAVDYRLHLLPQHLPHGAIVGSAELFDCTEHDGMFHWHLRDPRRFAQHLHPVGHPQPVWFFPFHPLSCIRA